MLSVCDIKIRRMSLTAIAAVVGLTLVFPGLGVDDHELPLVDELRHAYDDAVAQRDWLSAISVAFGRDLHHFVLRNLRDQYLDRLAVQPAHLEVAVEVVVEAPVEVAVAVEAAVAVAVEGAGVKPTGVRVHHTSRPNNQAPPQQSQNGA